MSVTDQFVVEEVEPPAAVPPPRGRRFRAGLVSLLAGTFLAGGLAGGLVYARTSSPGRSPQPTATANSVPSPVPTTPGGGIDVRAVLARVEPAVVSIKASVSSRFGRGTSAGTGMIISADGYVLTNAHVVEGAQSVQVTVPNNGTHAATVAGVDDNNDVAVLKVEGVKDLPTVQLGHSKSLQVGDPVVAVGNALALNGSPTVTTGIVSALDRSINGENGAMQHLIQTDAAINPGNSGGPLVDSGGRVVGMNTAVAGNAQNIGFALAIDEVTPELDGLKKGEASAATSAAYLGVQLQESIGGAMVAAVASGSPAANAGLRAGDVITKVDDADIEDAADLVAAVRSHKPGDQVRVTTQRGTVSVTLGSQSSS